MTNSLALFQALLLLGCCLQQTTLAEKDNEPGEAQRFLPVKVVKETADANWDVNTLDFTAITERMLQQRAGANNINNISTAAAPFPGPDLLSPLLAQCFLYDDQQQYIFRVCPFSNVTQHEKSPYAFNFLTTSFHAVLGLYRRWYVAVDGGEEEEGERSSRAATAETSATSAAAATTASFDSLLYLEGDQCDQGVARQVRLRLLCSTDWTMLDLAYVVNVTEVARCRYQATLASPLFCQLGTIQSRLDRAGQREWSVLEALLRGGLISRAGHQHYLERLLNRYGLTARKVEEVLVAKSGQSQVENQPPSGGNSTHQQHAAALHSCEERVQKLEREVAELRAIVNSGGSGGNSNNKDNSK